MNLYSLFVYEHKEDESPKDKVSSLLTTASLTMLATNFEKICDICIFEQDFKILTIC